MCAWGMLAFLFACSENNLKYRGGEEEEKTPDPGDPEDTATETPDPVDTGDTADTAPPDDTADPPDTGDVECDTVTFTDLKGNVTDMTEVFIEGAYTTMKEPGTLAFCPGEWFVRLIVEADLAVVGLGETREDTVLSSGERGTILHVEGAEGADLTLSVDNATLDRGTADANGSYEGAGGIYLVHGHLSLTDVAFTNNGGDDGGALHAKNCSIDGSNVAFLSNEATDEAGAAYIYRCNVNLADVSFEDNYSLQLAAAFQLHDSTAEIRGATFARNAAGMKAGAILVNDSALVLEDASFLENTAGSGNGGAIVSSEGEVTLEDVRFEGNTAAEGGAIYHYSTSYLLGEDCDFVDNAPDDIQLSTGWDLVLGEGVSFECDFDSCAEE